MHYRKHLLILFFVWHSASLPSVYALGAPKTGRLLSKATYEASRQNWPKAINYIDRALQVCIENHHEADPTNCIHALATANNFYNVAGKLLEVSDRIEKAYYLAKENLKPTSTTAQKTRIHYYKLLILEQSYVEAISIVSENMANLTEEAEISPKRLQYLGQLFSLYGLTNQRENEITILKEMLHLSSMLHGMEYDSNRSIILNLGKAYCESNNYHAYNALMTRYKLSYSCLFK